MLGGKQDLSLNCRSEAAATADTSLLRAPAPSAGSVEVVQPGAPAVTAVERPCIRGKFLFVGDQKMWVRGVSYGAFRPDAQGKEYFEHEVIERDFAQMAELGINTVRIPHTMPPRSLLDIAHRHDLRVMVGLSAEQYAGYLIDRKKAPDIEGEIRAKVASCAGHPALLCYVLGNEILAPIVRWVERRRVENYLKALYRAVKDEDPEGLVSYVNYPTTEYLDLSFLDFLAFNVYLEKEEHFRAYLARLQNLAGGKPLIMTEIGLDSLRNGEQDQAKSLEWQIRTAFEAGCAGTIIFSWTDEWYRAGAEVGDWAFGITDKLRRPKAAATTVQKVFEQVPFAPSQIFPMVSVVVCSYNGARTIRDALDALALVNYPGYEVIVVSDGSTDATPEICKEYDVRLVCTENQGLSAARNEGLRAASGEIVAYIDDDAYPDPDWLRFLAGAFARSQHVGIGGPNLPPPGDGEIATCVANAPGGPAHVLLDDETAEHIPGCNMAFKKEALEAIGGFDPRFRAAGDDVDICWRLQERGWTIGFCPAAVVWHRRRNSIRAYWKQQRGYGKAEALLEDKWPEKYNGLGHLSWKGRIYGEGITLPFLARQRVYHGLWGSAPFQFLYEPAPNLLSSLLLMPEWYIVVMLLALTSALGFVWPPMFGAAPFLAIAALLPTVQAFRSSARASFMYDPNVSPRRLRMWAVTAFMHLLQPIARLVGRRFGRSTRSPKRPRQKMSLPFARNFAIWTEDWQSPESYLQAIDKILRQDHVHVRYGTAFDRWDLEVSRGVLAGARLLMAVEDHGAGNQYLRFRVWPIVSTGCIVAALALAVLAAAATSDGAGVAAALLGAGALYLVIRAVWECRVVQAVIGGALKTYMADWTDA